VFRSPLHLVRSVLRESGAETTILLYATIFYALAGLVAGSVFTTSTLLLLLTILVAQAVSLSLVDVHSLGSWTIINVAVVQVGYLAGIFTRRILEQAGYAIPPAEIRWPQ